MINNIATINKNPIEISKGIGGFTFHGEGERWLGRKSDSCAIEIKRLSPSPLSRSTIAQICVHRFAHRDTRSLATTSTKIFRYRNWRRSFHADSPDSCYRVSTDWNGIPPQELDRTLKSSLPQFIVSSDCRLVIFFFFLIFRESYYSFFFSHFVFFVVCNVVENDDIGRLVYLFFLFSLHRSLHFSSLSHRTQLLRRNMREEEMVSDKGCRWSIYRNYVQFRRFKTYAMSHERENV